MSGIPGRHAPERVAIKRLKERGGLSEEQARARIRSRMPSEERAKHADIIIDTDCELSEVRARVDELWKALETGSIIVEYR